MGNFNLLEDIYISSKEKYNSIQALLKKGLIKKIGPEIYTSKIDEEPESVIQRNLIKIIGEKFPGSIISHRSAFELVPFQGNIFISTTYTDKISLPGVVINLLKGPGPLLDDIPLLGAVYSQRERALLENLQIAKGKPSKCISRDDLEGRLEIFLRTHGEAYLNEIRDKARIISEQLNMPGEFSKLNNIIGAMLRTRPVSKLKSDVAKARINNIPYDIYRIRLFEKLFHHLNKNTFKKLEDQNITKKSYFLFAFFESYFSNFIEGTKFKIEDAKQIIDTGVPMKTRENDSHDILGTFRLVSDKASLSITPETSDDFIQLIKLRHNILLSSRPNFEPGAFKEIPNQAGNTVFVDPPLVEGTLRKGFEFYRALQEPFAKAAFIMFLISEVHPFNDGNGRIARVFMNSELTKDNQSKIIITTKFRDDYILCLKKITNQHDCELYTRMLRKAHEFSHKIKGEDFKEVFDFLNKTHEFDEVRSTLKIPELKQEVKFKDKL